ncbi:HopJ type III effector protein [Hydrocarboniclastica marina]|uniref:Type III effector n=1 Tax=Hydrocarboniclastica marina TaxID=2259620 RepID=A0A4P7XF49_9ALTE|nr:HopJ type III effector protein [Hydrocarboniclastica marina]MAL97108.1 type III effector [Alteromonadaceae bacterium]QCF25516.1 type III effector [Hydrocarboniclastica marina]
MTRETFLKKLNTAPDDIQFTDTMAVIDAGFTFTPTGFRNGDLNNEPGQNSGSCKLLAFARREGLSEAQVLACFGDYYRKDVLNNPSGTDHQNIRNFMRTGWKGVSFEGEPLAPRA